MPGFYFFPPGRNGNENFLVLEYKEFVFRSLACGSFGVRPTTERFKQEGGVFSLETSPENLTQHLKYLLYMDKLLVVSGLVGVFQILLLWFCKVVSQALAPVPMAGPEFKPGPGKIVLGSYGFTRSLPATTRLKNPNS